MYIRVAYIIFGVWYILVIFMAIFMLTPNIDAECERIHIDDNHKLWGTRDAVPNEEVAYKIAYAVIYEQLKHEGGEEFSPDDYYSEIMFNEISNEWEIYFAPIPPEGYITLGGDMIINIRKDCGMVTELGFYK